MTQEQEIEECKREYMLGYIAGSLDVDEMCKFGRSTHIYYQFMFLGGNTPTYQILRNLKKFAIARGVTQERLDELTKQVEDKFTDPEFVNQQVANRRSAMSSDTESATSENSDAEHPNRIG